MFLRSISYVHNKHVEFVSFSFIENTFCIAMLIFYETIRIKWRNDFSEKCRTLKAFVSLLLSDEGNLRQIWLRKRICLLFFLMSLFLVFITTRRLSDVIFVFLVPWLHVDS